jgi:predicted transglutaminase-like cysteine proteinase
MKQPNFIFELPPLDKMPNVDKKEVLEYITEKRTKKVIITWAINWWYKSKRERLCAWIKDNLEIDDEIKDLLKHIPSLKTNREKILEILRFIIKHISYARDIDLYGTDEYWATPKETWLIKKGDCEDMGILAYAIARHFEIPDYQLFITAGNVEGGAHAYLIYLDDNGIEYPIDAAYWPRLSLELIPYIKRKDYFYGGKEWFRFNSTSAYIVERY